MPADTTHQCPGPGCERRVPVGQLACRTHWFQVPEPLRNEVWAAWRVLMRAIEQPGDLTPAGERHKAALAAAIATMREVGRG